MKTIPAFAVASVLAVTFVFVVAGMITSMLKMKRVSRFFIAASAATATLPMAAIYLF